MLTRVMMIAGEASGDLHGSGVVRELKRRLPALEVYGIGGDCMKREGMELFYHVSELSFMGFAEVLRNIPLIRSIERMLEAVLVDRRPDVLVLIDFPGFNLRFARKAKRLGIKILYYISPQVWAWNIGRIRKMKMLVDRMKVVFPFEVSMYREAGVDVEFVGHPLVESVESSTSRTDFFSAHSLDSGRKLLALFPGSRKQEIEKILPVVLRAAHAMQRTHNVQVAIGVASTLGTNFIKQFLDSAMPITLIENATYDLMRRADAAIVTSGTATLEAGWLGTPMIIVYRTSPVTFFMGRMLVHLPDIGLANIVAGKRVVPELIQHEMTETNIVSAVSRLLDDESYARAMRSELSIIKSKLGVPGASARVAEGIIALAGTA